MLIGEKRGCAFDEKQSSIIKIRELADYKNILIKIARTLEFRISFLFIIPHY